MSIIIDNSYFSAIRNPKWVNAEHTFITCEVNFIHVGFEEWTPFMADPNDYMPYSKMIFDRCAAGEYGPVVEPVIVEIEGEEAMYGSSSWREAQASVNNPIPSVIL